MACHRGRHDHHDHHHQQQHADAVSSCPHLPTPHPQTPSVQPPAEYHHERASLLAREVKQYGEDSSEGLYEEGSGTALLSMMDIAKFAMTVGGGCWWCWWCWSCRRAGCGVQRRCCCGLWRE
jgi:hypothetical protein